MAIIVRNRETHKQYALVGTGYGEFKPSRHGKGWSAPVASEDHHEMIAVCDATGRVYWLPSAHIDVLSIDGTKPSELLQG